SEDRRRAGRAPRPPAPRRAHARACPHASARVPNRARPPPWPREGPRARGGPLRRLRALQRRVHDLGGHARADGLTVKSVALLAVVVATLLVTALVSPWVTWGLAAWTGHRFGLARVYDRVFELLLVAAVAGGWRRLDLGSPAAIGFRGARWDRDVGIGIGAGLLGLATGLALCWTFGSFLPSLRFPW